MSTTSFGDEPKIIKDPPNSQSRKIELYKKTVLRSLRLKIRHEDICAFAAVMGGGLLDLSL